MSRLQALPTHTRCHKVTHVYVSRLQALPTHTRCHKVTHVYVSRLQALPTHTRWHKVTHVYVSRLQALPTHTRCHKVTHVYVSRLQAPPTHTHTMILLLLDMCSIAYRDPSRTHKCFTYLTAATMSALINFGRRFFTSARLFWKIHERDNV